MILFVKKIFGEQNFLVKKNCWSKKFFGQKKIFGQKNFLVKNFFGSRKYLGKKNWVKNIWDGNFFVKKNWIGLTQV